MGDHIARLEALPDELLVDILSHLSISELLNVGLVSRRLYDASQTPALWVRFLKCTAGLQLRPDVLRRIVPTHIAPGAWDGQSWAPGLSTTLSISSSLWRIPSRITSYLADLLWPREVELAAPLSDDDAEVAEGDQILVHFPTLIRSRRYIREEMELIGAHRAYDPSNLRNYPYDGDGVDSDDADAASVASTSDQAVNPNFLWSFAAHSSKVYVTRIRGQWLLSGSRDRTFKIWRIPALPLDGRNPEYGPFVVHTEAAHDGSVLCLDFDVESGLIVTGSSDKSARIWQVDWGQGDDTKWTGVRVTLLTMLNEHTQSVSGVALTKDHLVTCSHDGRVLVYDRATITSPNPTVLHDWHGFHQDSGYPAGLALSPDCSKVLLSGYKFLVAVDLFSGTHSIQLRNSRHRVTGVAWKPDCIVSACESKIVVAKSWDDSVPWEYIDERRGSVRAVDVVPSLQMLYCSSTSGAIWPVKIRDPNASYRSYQFQDEPILTLDREGTCVCTAVREKVCVIMYGVGKPYACLFQ